MGLTFFGLTPNEAPQSRAAIFRQIHDVVFHGGGGYDWYAVYNMPIWLRRFTHNQIATYIQNQNESLETQQNGGKKSLINSDGKVNTPEFLEASKQYKKPAKYK